MAEQTDLGEQGRDSGIDPENTGTETEWRKALLLEALHFKINPASFRADGDYHPLTKQAACRLGNILVSFRMGEKPNPAISQQLRKKVFHEWPEAGMDGDLRGSGVNGLLKSKEQRFRKGVVLDKGGVEKTFFNPVGVYQKYPVHPHGDRLGQDPFQHDRARHGQDQVSGGRGWRLGGEMHLQHYAVAVHLPDTAGAKQAAQHADPDAVPDFAAENLADVFGAAAGQGDVVIGQFLRME